MVGDVREVLEHLLARPRNCGGDGDRTHGAEVYVRDLRAPSGTALGDWSIASSIFVKDRFFPAPEPFDPQLGLFYVVARRVYSIFYYTATGKPEGWAGRDHNIWEESTLRAIDYRTGEIRWNHELGPNESVAGVLTTAGNLLFTGDAQGNLLVLDPATGKTLWHVNAGGSMLSSPMTYALDGRQYVVEGVQGVLYAWALPE